MNDNYDDDDVDDNDDGEYHDDDLITRLLYAHH